MLDDLDYVTRFDSDNALAVAAGQPEHLLFKDFKFAPTNFGQIDNVVLTGMGGSALAGLLLRSWVEDKLKIPYVITRNYTLPNFVGANTLVIVSSYSGNTEETLAALADAKQRGSKIVVITSGGKAAKLAAAEGYPLLSLPTGYQPRMAYGYELKCLAVIFEKLGLAAGLVSELTDTAAWLATTVKNYAPQVKTPDNLAKQIADKLMARSVIIYAGDGLGSAAYKWKVSINESAKNLAWCNEFSEVNHNEFISWTSHPVQKPFAVVELSSEYDHPRMAKRMEITNRLLAGKMPAPIQVKAEGKSKIAQILWTTQLGEFVAIYLAVLNGVNPTPVELIEKFKQELQ